MTNRTDRRQLPARFSPRPIRATVRRVAAARQRQSAAAYLRLNRGLLGFSALTLVAAVVINLVMADQYVAWTGVESIPTGGAR